MKNCFFDDRGTKPTVQKDIERPPILKEEVQAAIKKMKNGKAVGPDGICIEMIKALEDFGIELLPNMIPEKYQQT